MSDFDAYTEPEENEEALREHYTAQFADETPTVDDNGEPVQTEDDLALEAMDALARELDLARSEIADLRLENENANKELAEAVQIIERQRDQITALRNAFERNGPVFLKAEKFKTDGALYARETIEQRARQVITEILG